MEDRSFKRAYSQMHISDEGMERILEAAKAPRPTGASRAARTAVGAVLVLVLLTGTAMAASPALRSLFWGDFDGLEQTVEPDDQSTCVYDGVEARIDSALSDGYFTVIHVAVRDTEGDRLSRLYDEYLAAEDKRAWTRENIRGYGTGTGDFAGMGVGTAMPPEILGYDSETGTLMLEFKSTFMTYGGGPATVCVDLYTGSFGTEKVTGGRTDEIEIPAGTFWTVGGDKDGDNDGDNDVETVDVHSSGSFGTDKDAEGDEPQAGGDLDGVDIGPGIGINAIPLTGWSMTSDVETVPLREGTVGSATVAISDIGMTLRGKGGISGEIRITLKDGTEPTALEDWMSGDERGGIMDDLVRQVSFTRPIPVEEIESVTINGVQVVFN